MDEAYSIILVVYILLNRHRCQGSDQQFKQHNKQMTTSIILRTCPTIFGSNHSHAVFFSFFFGSSLNSEFLFSVAVHDGIKKNKKNPKFQRENNRRHLRHLLLLGEFYFIKNNNYFSFPWLEGGEFFKYLKLRHWMLKLKFRHQMFELNQDQRRKMSTEVSLTITRNEYSRFPEQLDIRPSLQKCPEI